MLALLRRLEAQSCAGLSARFSATNWLSSRLDACASAADSFQARPRDAHCAALCEHSVNAIGAATQR